MVNSQTKLAKLLCLMAILILGAGTAFAGVLSVKFAANENSVKVGAKYKCTVEVTNTGSKTIKSYVLYVKLTKGLRRIIRNKKSGKLTFGKRLKSLGAGKSQTFSYTIQAVKAGSQAQLAYAKIGKKVVGRVKAKTTVGGGGGPIIQGGPSAAELSKIAAEKEARIKRDPKKILGVNDGQCGACHANQVAAWEKMHHHKTFRELHKRPKAKALFKIVKKALGLKDRSIRKSQVCTQCHYTMKEERGKPKAISGISCESCHGAAKEWKDLHNKQADPNRFKKAEAAGMLRPTHVYLVAENCYNCHTVPNEALVNSGHKAGSADFELVSWSQGEVRHNFLDGSVNKPSPIERRRIMFVVGSMLNLEYGLRGVAKATTAKGRYFKAMKTRLYKAVGTLGKVKKVVKIPQIDKLFKILGGVKVEPNKHDELMAASTKVGWAIQEFVKEFEGKGGQLSALDSFFKNLKPKGTPHGG